MREEFNFALICFILLMSFSFISSSDLGTVEKGECIDLYQYCPSCTYTNLTTVKYPNVSISRYNDRMTKSNSDYNYTFCNTENLGEYFYTVCGDKDSTLQCEEISFEVTTTGKTFDSAKSISNITVILFLIFLMGAFFYSTKKVDLKKWHNGLLKRYESRNYIKLVLGSIAYNILKNNYLIYYLIGFPLILSITNIVYDFGIDSMITIMSVFLNIYTLGAIIVGLYLFSNVQEWIMDLMEEIKNLEWGVE